MASELKNAQAPGSTTHERSQVHSAVQRHTLSFQNAVTLDTKSQSWEQPCNLSTKNRMPLCEKLFCHHHILYLSDTTSATYHRHHVLHSMCCTADKVCKCSMLLVPCARYLLAVLVEVALVQ
uniref:Uncharacterized protein n=1 Tax=Ixodes ricinus TaxID=34613 RepID=A0A147BND9_IXORI